VNSLGSALDWLYSTQLFGIKPGLAPMIKLAGILGIPTESAPVSQAGDGRNGPAYIHVAGTNGKGSTCAFIASICREAGFRTGLYTSPHLISFQERIQLNGNYIPEDDVLEGVLRIRASIKDWDPHPTFFEITTALALAWFKRRDADIVVLETGMGGRLDATNIVTPIVSVITPIAFDHEKYLGDTLETIAGEKAGIIKKSRAVVSSLQHPAAKAALNSKAREMGTSILWADSPYNGPVGIPGKIQHWNAALATLAIQASTLPISTQTMQEGLSKTQWPGRFQQVSKDLILDGAHNPDAAKVLVENWRNCFGNEKAALIFGCMADKNIAEILKVLEPIVESIHLTTIQSPRAVSVEQLQAICGSLLPAIPTDRHTSLKGALEAPTQKRRLVTGSLFLVGDALALINKMPRKESLQ
jgi:dihydrofolate synthase/folylpolyglutamate synthase